MSIDDKIKAYESYPTEESVIERFNSENKPFLIKNITDIYNAKKGIYKIKNLTLLSNVDRYIIHIDEDDSYRSILSFMDWFDDTKTIDIVDRMISKEIYKDNAERIFTAVLVHLLMKNDFDNAVEFVYRILWHSTDSGKFIKTGFTNLSFGVAQIPFNAKIAYMQLLLLKNHPEIIVRKRYRMNQLICLTDMLRDNIDKMSKESIRRYSNMLKHYRIDLKPITRTALIHKNNNDRFLDNIESDASLFFDVCSHLDYYWNANEKIALIKDVYAKNSNRLINDIIYIFNNCVEIRLNLEQKAKLFLILNEKCEFLNIMDTVMPFLKNSMQTAILQKML